MAASLSLSLTWTWSQMVRDCGEWLSILESLTPHAHTHANGLESPNSPLEIKQVVQSMFQTPGVTQNFKLLCRLVCLLSSSSPLSGFLSITQFAILFHQWIKRAGTGEEDGCNSEKMKLSPSTCIRGDARLGYFTCQPSSPLHITALLQISLIKQHNI